MHFVKDSKREKHTALIDCELLAKVYINLLGQKEPTLDFSDSKYTNNLSKNIDIIDYSKKVITPSEVELKKHKEFIKNNIKKNYF